MAPFSIWGFLVGVFPNSWLFQKPGFESLCGEISSNKLFIVHCSGSILYESFVKLVERFVSNTHESIYLLVLKNFCTEYCHCSEISKVYYLRSLHRETQTLASEKARNVGKLQLRIPQEKMAPNWSKAIL